MKARTSEPLYLLCQECQMRLGHRLPLNAYLLKPVQRITKYQLLLNEMMKYTDRNNWTFVDLEVMLPINKYLTSA